MTYDLSRLEEHVLLPVDCGGAATCDAVLGGGVFLLTARLNGNKGADRVTTSEEEKQRSSLVY